MNQTNKYQLRILILFILSIPFNLLASPVDRCIHTGIAKEPQQIHFPAIADQLYATQSIALNASSNSGLPVAYQVIAGPAVIEGSLLKLTGTGLVTVEATQAGDENHDAAPPVPQTFLVDYNIQNSSANSTCSENQKVKIVVIGSSTAEGFGVNKEKESWVGRYTNYLTGINPNNEVINLAKGGYTTYHLLPDGDKPPNRPAPDKARNITKAIAENPDAIIINLPSNDAWKGYGVEEQIANFQTMFNTGMEKGIPVWITTTQPREKGATDNKNRIQEAVRDSILAHYGPYALDFWSDIATSDLKIKSEYALNDGIHLNPEGHKVLFEVVKNQGVFEKTLEMNNTYFQPVKSGLFSDHGIWNLNSVPNVKSSVLINGTHSVTLDTNVTIASLESEPNSILDLKDYQLSINCDIKINGKLLSDNSALELSGDQDIILQSMNSIPHLRINKTGGAVLLNQDLTVSGSMEMVNGLVKLNGNNLTLGNNAYINGGTSESYIVTNELGDLIYEISSNFIGQSLLFPVGDEVNYTPFIFTLTEGDVSEGKLFLKVVDRKPDNAETANPILSRYWHLRQEGISNYLYNVELAYLEEDVELSGNKSEEDLRVIKYSENTGWKIGGTVNTDDNILRANDISSFSTFSGGNSIEDAKPLPVELLEFTLKATQKGYAKLHWKTASETNNDYFAIEKSTDAVDWISVVRINGGGTSREVLNYYYTDYQPLPGKSYYRLKQVDFDGQYEYSPIIYFSNDSNLSYHVEISPNPMRTGDKLYVYFKGFDQKVKAKMEIRDFTGILLYQKNILTNNGRIDLTAEKLIHPGLYLLTFSQGQQVVHQKLIVN